MHDEYLGLRDFGSRQEVLQCLSPQWWFQFATAISRAQKVRQQAHAREKNFRFRKMLPTFFASPREKILTHVRTRCIFFENTWRQNFDFALEVGKTNTCPVDALPQRDVRIFQLSKAIAYECFNVIFVSKILQILLASKRCARVPPLPSRSAA